MIKILEMVAAIHAGWKGAYKRHCKKSCKIYDQKRLFTSKDMTATIGPCIASSKIIEIKQDFIKKFIKKDKKTNNFF